jgi:hypothetical protein
MKLTKPQVQLLKEIAVGKKYGAGMVASALVRKGLAKFFDHGSGVEITDAGRSALRDGGENDGP